MTWLDEGRRFEHRRVGVGGGGSIQGTIMVVMA